MAQNLGVGQIAQRHWIEVVGLHKLVEHVGAQHHRVGYVHRHAIEVVANGIVLYDAVDERNAAALASERPLPYAGKVAVTVETLTLELGHHTAVFHFAIFDNEVEKQLSHGRSLVDVAEAVHLHHLRYWEQGARVEPARNVIFLSVIQQRLGRNVENVVLQLLEAADTHYFAARVGVADYEVAKAEVVHYGLPEIDGQLFAVFVEESAAELGHAFAVFRVARLDDDGQVGVAVAQIARQAQTRVLVLDAAALERHIADYAQYMLAVVVVEPPGLLVVARQHHLWPSAHAQHGLVGVERLGGEPLRLAQDELIERGQNRGVEAHRVLNEQNHLYAHAHNVVLGIQLVLEQLDDGHQQVDIAQPAEHIVDPAEVLAHKAARHLARKRREHHNRRVGIHVLDFLCRGESLGDVDTRHGNDDVVVLLGQSGHGAGIVADARHTRRRAEV